MSWELQCTVRGSVPSLLAVMRPCRRASYSALLFEAPKFNLTVYSNNSPVGDIRTIPKSEPLEFAVPSIYNDQPVTSWVWSVPLMSSFLTGMFLFSGANSTTKSASTYPLMAVLGLCRTSYAPSWVPHLDILPLKSTLLNKAFKGREVSTIKVWA